MQSFTRRSALKGIGAASLLSATGLGGLAATTAQAQAKAVSVSHFGGPYQSLQTLVAAPFQQAGLGTVEYGVETALTAFTKIQSQRDNPPYDIVMVSRALAYQGGRIGIVKAIDKKSIPNLAEAVPEVLAPGDYGVAFVFDTMSIIADSRQVSAPITSWLDLWKPEFKGKIVLPSSALALTAFVIMCICKSVGSKKIDDENVEVAFQKLKELKPSVRTFYADPVQANQMVERGESAAAPQLNIRIANSMRANPTVARYVPAEGGPMVPFDLSIVTKAASPEAAAKYINFILRKDVQTALASELLATPVRPDITVREDLQRLVIPNTKSMWAIDEEYLAAKQRGWLDRWAREIQS